MPNCAKKRAVHKHVLDTCDLANLIEFEKKLSSAYL